MAVISVLAYLLMAGGTVLLVLARSLFSPLPIVIGLQLLGLALILWARVTFGRRSFHAAANPTAGGLVTTGPYAWVRHPIYTGVTLATWAGVGAHLSLLSVACGLLVVAGAAFRIWAEERMVRARYPEYDDYARRTARMVPGVF